MTKTSWTTAKESADTLVRQQDYCGAATTYQTLVTEIFEQSHPYSLQYYPEEEELERLLEECIDALGMCLADERADRVGREKIIRVLFDIYQHELHADNSFGFIDKASIHLVRYTTLLERDTIAEWICDRLTDQEQATASFQHQTYSKFLEDLEKDTLEAYLQVCRETGHIVPKQKPFNKVLEAYLQIYRETGRTSDLIDRLLTLGRIDEAEREAQLVNSSTLLSLVDLFIQHKQDAVAERLVRAHLKDKPPASNLPVIDVPEWLQEYYRARGNHAAQLEMTEILFRCQALGYGKRPPQPLLKHYHKLRDLARQLGRWEILQPELLAFLEQSQNTSLVTQRICPKLLTQIALDEGDIDKALILLQEIEIKHKKDNKRYYTTLAGYCSSVYEALIPDVARAAEETRPREAIGLYDEHIERLIARRNREGCQKACTYLAKMRALLQKLGQDGGWTLYIAMVRGQNSNQHVLLEELAKAGL